MSQSSTLRSVARGCSVLIVDDEPDMAFLAAQAIRLGDDGMEVDVAYSGDEAISKLAGDGVDVIVLDFRMPERNGLEVASEILATNAAQNIVLFSAYLDDETVAAAGRVGVRECVSKDAYRELVDIVRRYCPAA